jgi:hypothetical protein
MERKICRRIVKNYQDFYLYRLQKYRRNRKRKYGMGKKVVSQEKHTWWIRITFKRNVAEDLSEYRARSRASPENFGTLHELIANAVQRSDTPGE